MPLYHENKTAFTASLITVAILILFIVRFTGYSSSGKEQVILITEILASNTGAVYDEDGSSPDFIELYNAGKSEVNLLGWYLSDNSNRPLKWVIPSLTLAPGDYVYFFASGKDKQQSDGIWHTNFQISSGGTEKIVLTAPDGTVHRYIEPFTSKPNVSFGLGADFINHVYMSCVTPGYANAEPFFDDIGSIAVETATVYITEYMTQNRHFIPDENGLYHDWVELYNPGSEPVYLNNWYLTDNPSRLRKWAFPDDLTIPPGGYIVLYCSGLDTRGHVSFRLSSADKALIISDNNGEVIDEIEIFETPLFASYGRSTSNLPAGEDSLTNITGFFEVPTPGAANTGIPFASAGDLPWNKPTVRITEYMTNNTYFLDEDGHSSDWAELHNYGNHPIDLSGFYMSDKSANPDKWQLSEGLVLSPGEYIVIWLSGKSHAGHASFSLGGNDDTLLICDSFSRIVDSVPITVMMPNISAGRDENEPENWLFYPMPTPGEPNSTQGFTQLAGLEQSSIGILDETGREQPRAGLVKADTNELFVRSNQLINLRTDEPDGKIYYTLDGREPTQNSPEYTGPIEIKENTVLRARVYTADKLPGAVFSRTYLINTDNSGGSMHTIPVVALVSDPAGLFSYTSGIYADGPGWAETTPHTGANFWKNWERSANFAFYEEGELCVQADAGISIHGQNSREYPQKSFSINFKKQYGQPRLIYPLIPGISRTVFDALILRNSGQDIYETKMRDAVTQNSVLDVTNIISMGARPVAVYINGEYWGLYNLHEKINEDYLEINEGIPNGEADIIKRGGTIVNRGTINDYRAMENTLRDMLANGEINTNEAYAYINSNIDIDNWIDYWVTVTYFGNTATHNIKCYRQQGGQGTLSETGKWRWVLYDQDHSMRFTSMNPFANMLSAAGHGGYHGEYFLTSNVIERALMRNDKIKERFLARYAELLRSVLHPDRLIGIIDGYAAQIETEISRHIARWPGIGSADRWRQNVEITRNFIYGRNERLARYMQTTLKLTDTQITQIFGS